MSEPAPTLAEPPQGPAPGRVAGGRRGWLRRPGRLLAVAALVALIVAALVAVPAVYAWARWYELPAGRAALARYHNAEAIGHLSACMTVLPHDPEALLLSARAARRDRAFDKCQALLDQYQAVCGTTDDLVLERALLRATRGDVDGVARFLVGRSKPEDPAAPLVLEAWAEGCLRSYRLREAEDAITHWLSLQPENAQAFFFQGRLHEAYEDKPGAVKGYERCLELDPTIDEARERLAVVLVDMAKPAEALPHLEYLHQRHPHDLEVMVTLARCQDQMGEAEKAAGLLDAALAQQPHYSPALAERGWLYMRDQQWPQAETCLREAADLDPSNSTIWFRLAQVLRQNGKHDEAQRADAHFKEIQDDLVRIKNILQKQLPQRPHDPDLMCEAGKIGLRTGAVAESLEWFERALRENPNHRPTHEALAEYYQRIGEVSRARRHRELAKPPAGAPAEGPADTTAGRKP